MSLLQCDQMFEGKNCLNFGTTKSIPAQTIGILQNHGFLVTTEVRRWLADLVFFYGLKYFQLSVFQILVIHKCYLCQTSRSFCQLYTTLFTYSIKNFIPMSYLVTLIADTPDCVQTLKGKNANNDKRKNKCINNQINRSVTWLCGGINRLISRLFGNPFPPIFVRAYIARLS